MGSRGFFNSPSFFGSRVPPGTSSSNGVRTSSSGAPTSRAGDDPDDELGKEEQERRDQALAERLQQEQQDEELALRMQREQQEDTLFQEAHGVRDGPGISSFGPHQTASSMMRPNQGMMSGPTLNAETPSSAHGARTQNVYNPYGGTSMEEATSSRGTAASRGPSAMTTGNQHQHTSPSIQGGARGGTSSSSATRRAASGSSTARGTSSDDMVYVACEFHTANMTVEMMVDTGAQSSVISRPLMEQLKLEGLLNRRKQGVAAGVGTAKIMGHLERVPVTLGHVEFTLDFAVLDVAESLLMLGIDQMRRFKCIVDLERDVLVFGGRDGVEVPFLMGQPKPTARLVFARGASGSENPGACEQM
ncbi:unnamed protein product [Amoebophrya sp. A25]|nr:unnamed protein product [Amoebophrya sp. A25]|eukprot:GSA25T00003108001.1